MKKYDPKRTWRHNAFFGKARWAEVSMANIARTDSVTPEAQALAERIANDCRELHRLLKTRVDL